MTKAYIALGSNLGNRREYLRSAVAGLGDVRAASHLYETDPIGGPMNQGPYLNLVVEVETEESPHELLELCQKLEADAGRVRDVRWGPRTLDVDIVLFGDLEIDTDELQIPHPRMGERRFVLEPLADLAPELTPDGWDERLPAGGITRVDDL